MKLLIGYDGSECSGEAIDELRRAGLAGSEVEAIVLTVADVWTGAPADDFARRYPHVAERTTLRHEQMLAEARTISQSGCDRLAKLFPAWRARADAVADSPYWGLVKRAQEWQADLISLGSHGRGVVARAVFGSVSHSTALYAHCSVRIGRCRPDRADRPDAPARIAVGWDGSPDALLAVRAVAKRRWPSGSQARLITAADGRLPISIPPPDPASAAAPAAIVDERDELVERAGAAGDELRAAGLDVAEPLIRAGDPKRVLMDEARTWDADCIFVGAKGLSRIERVLLGSVSAAVAARAECSVEIVRG